MAVCSRCGGQLNPQERFCGNCGLDTQAAPPQPAPQPTVQQPAFTQQAAPQVIYTPPAAQAASGKSCGCTARAAMGLGIGGGLMGILWGGLAPYLSVQFPSNIQWGVYTTGLKDIILLIIGLVAGALAVVGGACATKALGLARLLLVIAGLAGFLVGVQWMVPGALILAAAGLAIAAKPQQ
jgi:hypothetical protein